MAKSQTRQATQMSRDIYNKAPSTFSPITESLGGESVSGGTGPSVGAEAKAGFEKISDTGGYDPTQLAKISGGYENLYETGGMSPEERADFINAATSGVRGTYDVLEAQEQRKRAATGQGVGGGEYAELARESTAAQAEAGLKARTQLQQVIAANQQAGLAGLGATEASVAAGRRAGVAGEAGLNQQLLSAIGLQVGSEEEATSIMAGLSKTPGLFGNILAAIQSISGSHSSGPSGSTWSIGAA